MPHNPLTDPSRSVDDRPRSLYVHVPFCTRRCSYCDFAVQATREAPTAEWLDAVAGEMRMLAEERGWIAPLRLDTVYLGGGTPSLLGPAAMAALRERLHPWARWDDSAEWTCEANPESFTPDVARGWRAAGVNRISLGVQSFEPAALLELHTLQALDATLAGASLREMAEGLFGADAVAAELLHAHAEPTVEHGARRGREGTCELANLGGSDARDRRRPLAQLLDDRSDIVLEHDHARSRVVDHGNHLLHG